MSSLSFLGLAEKAGKLRIGDEECGMASRAGKAKLLLTAADAGRSSLVRAENYITGKCVHARLPYTKEELGAALGRGAVSMAAVTDAGMASAFMKKLAAEYPETYEDAAAALEMLAERAAERRREARRHKENVRRGKRNSRAR